MDNTNPPFFQPYRFSTLRTFSDPVLHKGSKWYIDFQAMDPVSGKMKRKKYYVKKCTTVRQRMKVANEMLSFLYARLHEGWSPWTAEDYSASMSTFADCLENYCKHVSHMSNKKTCSSYMSRVNILKQFISTQTKPIIMAYQFDTSFCSFFLDHIFIERRDSARTRNNYRDWLFNLAEFLKCRSYIKENPVGCIGHLAEDAKHRKELSETMLKRLASYLKKHDRHFYLACLMEYYTLIRPNELSFMKVGYINVKEQTIHVPDEVSKNGIGSDVVLNDSIIKLMLDLGVLTRNTDCYIFSNGFMPGTEYIGPDHFSKRWREVRKVLGWSDRYMFYSLKDSGIRDLANGHGIVTARDQARHADASTTNRYIAGRTKHEGVKGFKGALDW